MKGTGLVLAGGGGKGAYQIGVWKALDEFNISNNIVAVSGTSVGALNAVLFSQGDIELAEKAWLSINNDDMFKIRDIDIVRDIPGFIKDMGKSNFISIPGMTVYYKSCNMGGMISRDGIKHIIDNYIDLNKVSFNTMHCYATCVEVPVMKKVVFDIVGLDPVDILSILYASSALPIVYGVEEYKGRTYLDGSLPPVGDNVPVQPLYDLGIRNFIVVNLNRTGFIDENKFPDCKFVQIVPSEDLGDLINGTLDFSKKGAERRIKQGYDDTKIILDMFYSTVKNQRETYNNLMEIRNDEKEFIYKRSEILDKRKGLKERLKVEGGQKYGQTRKD